MRSSLILTSLGSNLCNLDTSQRHLWLRKETSLGLDKYSLSLITFQLLTFVSQTFGELYESDGRLQGTADVQTVNCNTSTNTCQIKVPAPGFALVFLSNPESPVVTDVGAQATFSTTVQTKTVNTATIAEDALETSNGGRGKDSMLGSTSPGSKNPASSHRIPGCLLLCASIIGGLCSRRMLW